MISIKKIITNDNTSLQNTVKVSEKTAMYDTYAKSILTHKIIPDNILISCIPAFYGIEPKAVSDKPASTQNKDTNTGLHNLLNILFSTIISAKDKIDLLGSLYKINMNNKHYSLEQISDITGKSIEEIKIIISKGQN